MQLFLFRVKENVPKGTHCVLLSSLVCDSWAQGVELSNLDQILGKNLLIQTKLCMRIGRDCTHCSMAFFY